MANETKDILAYFTSEMAVFHRDKEVVKNLEQDLKSRLFDLFEHMHYHGLIDQNTKVRLTSQFFAEFGHGNATKQL